MLFMPLERTRQSYRKHRSTDLNIILTPITTELPESFPVDSPEDDLPPLVDAPPSFDDELPPLIYGPPPGLPLLHTHPPRASLLPTDNFPPSPGASLFPDGPDAPNGPRPSHHRKRPPDHIPRPPNAFILFRASFIKAQHIPGTIEPNNNTLSRIIGMCWKSLPEEERDVWRAKARRAMEDHKRLYPSYRYNPRDQQNRAVSAGRAKRKVKEISGPPPDPERCQEIARMLVEGIKGDELESAVKELDQITKIQSPERAVQVMQARFDAPMTERTFQRRSASVPPPVKEEDTVGELPNSTPKLKQKQDSRTRSCSTGTRSRGNAGAMSKISSTPMTKQEEVDQLISESQFDSEREIPFKYYASQAFNAQGHCVSGASSPSYLSTPPTPSGMSSSLPAIAQNTLDSPQPGSPSPLFRAFLPPDSPLTPVHPFGLPSPISGPTTPSHDTRFRIVTGMEVLRQSEDRDDGLLNTRSKDHSSGGPFKTTFSSLEGWDGISPRYGEYLDTAETYVGGGGTTPLSSSPMTPPMHGQYDNAEHRGPALTGHASEFLDQDLSYEVPAFNLSSRPDDNVSSSSLPDARFYNATPCSPMSPGITTYMHALDINSIGVLSHLNEHRHLISKAREE